MKRISFIGDSLKRIKGFPEQLRRECGYQLDRTQRGLNPAQWKPIKTLGPGVTEIRLQDENGIYRVLYVTRRGTTIYVLHAFQKKSRKTSQKDIVKGQQAYKTMLEIENSENQIL